LKSKDSRLFLIFWLCAILGSYVPICTRYFRKCGNESSTVLLMWLWLNSLVEPGSEWSQWNFSSLKQENPTLNTVLTWS
jgi:hypothetical protein